MGFQNKINLKPAIGWHGDFASVNPRVSLLSNDENQNGAYQVGDGGVKAGSFVWVDAGGVTVSNSGSGSPDGFVGREMTGITVQYLQENSMAIPKGFMVTVYERGEFYVELPVTFDSVTRKAVVYVSSKTGDVIASTDPDAVATNYKYAGNAQGGDLVKISAWI